MPAYSHNDIHFCPRCASHLVREERYGHLRPVCPECGWIYFADPKVAVAVIVEEGNCVLLVRRANDPQRGLWTLPAGFMDAGEDPQRAAERECQEETGLQVRVTGLVDVLAGQEHPRGAHLLIVYRAKVQSGQLHPGDDVDEAAFFPKEYLPPLAFSSTRRVLNQ